MSVTVITSQTISLSGLKATHAAANASGSTVVNTGKTFLSIINADSGAITATFDDPNPCNFGFSHDVALVVSAGTTQLVGPFPIGRFNDASGNLAVSFSAVDGVTVAALELA